MKTIILQHEKEFPTYTDKKQVLIVSETKFYDKYSEKYTLLICYYD